MSKTSFSDMRIPIVVMSTPLYALPSRTEMMHNLLSAFYSAKLLHSKQAFDDALNWYGYTHTFALTLVKSYRITLTQAAKILAIYSGNSDWYSTVNATIISLEVYRDGGDILEEAGGTFRFMFWATGEMRQKVQAIMEGENIPVSKPEHKKIRNFARLIENPNDEVAVVIDRHIVRAACGADSYISGSGNVMPHAAPIGAAYEAVANALRNVACDLGMTAAELQSVLYVHASQ